MAVHVRINATDEDIEASFDAISKIVGRAFMQQYTNLGLPGLDQTYGERKIGRFSVRDEIDERYITRDVALKLEILLRGYPTKQNQFKIWTYGLYSSCTCTNFFGIFTIYNTT